MATACMKKRQGCEVEDWCAGDKHGDAPDHGSQKRRVKEVPMPKVMVQKVLPPIQEGNGAAITCSGKHGAGEGEGKLQFQLPEVLLSTSTPSLLASGPITGTAPAAHHSCAPPGSSTSVSEAGLPLALPWSRRPHH